MNALQKKRERKRIDNKRIIIRNCACKIAQHSCSRNSKELSFSIQIFQLSKHFIYSKTNFTNLNCFKIYYKREIRFDHNLKDS